MNSTGKSEAKSRLKTFSVVSARLNLLRVPGESLAPGAAVLGLHCVSESSGNTEDAGAGPLLRDSGSFGLRGPRAHCLQMLPGGSVVQAR